MLCYTHLRTTLGLPQSLGCLSRVLMRRAKPHRLIQHPDDGGPHVLVRTAAAHPALPTAAPAALLVQLGDKATMQGGDLVEGAGSGQALEKGCRRAGMYVRAQAVPIKLRTWCTIP